MHLYLCTKFHSNPVYDDLIQLQCAKFLSVNCYTCTAKFVKEELSPFIPLYTWFAWQTSVWPNCKMLCQSPWGKWFIMLHNKIIQLTALVESVLYEDARDDQSSNSVAETCSFSTPTGQDQRIQESARRDKYESPVLPEPPAFSTPAPTGRVSDANGSLLYSGVGTQLCTCTIEW